jgi:hypothetical protein
MLNIFVPEIGLQRSGVMAVIRELVTAGVTQLHMCALGGKADIISHPNYGHPQESFDKE